jgi:hypothetical protein
MWIADATVHTTGINWESVVTIIASITTILAVLGAAVTRFVTGRITMAIHEFQIAVVDKLDSRLTELEAKVDTVNRKIPARTRRGQT